MIYPDYLEGYIKRLEDKCIALFVALEMANVMLERGKPDEAKQYAVEGLEKYHAICRPVATNPATRLAMGQSQ